MTKIVPFTDAATDHEAKVLRLMLYSTVVIFGGAEIGGSIELHNKTFEYFEEVLKRLDSPEHAAAFAIEEGTIEVVPSDSFQEAVRRVNETFPEY